MENKAKNNSFQKTALSVAIATVLSCSVDGAFAVVQGKHEAPDEVRFSYEASSSSSEDGLDMAEASRLDGSASENVDGHSSFFNATPLNRQYESASRSLGVVKTKELEDLNQPHAKKEEISSLEQQLRLRTDELHSAYEAVQYVSEYLIEREKELYNARKIELELKVKCNELTTLIDVAEAIIHADLDDKLPRNPIDVRLEDIDRSEEMHRILAEKEIKARHDELERFRNQGVAAFSSADKPGESQSTYKERSPSAPQTALQPKEHSLEKVQLVSEPEIQSFVSTLGQDASFSSLPVEAGDSLGLKRAKIQENREELSHVDKKINDLAVMLDTRAQMLNDVNQKLDNLLKGVAQKENDADDAYKRVAGLEKECVYLKSLVGSENDVLQADYADQPRDSIAARKITNILNERFVTAETKKRRDELVAWSQQEEADGQRKYLSVADKVRELDEKAKSLKGEKLIPVERLIKAFVTPTAAEIATEKQKNQRMAELDKLVAERREAIEQESAEAVLIAHSAARAAVVAQQQLAAILAEADEDEPLPAPPTQQQLAAILGEADEDEPLPAPPTQQQLAAILGEADEDEPFPAPAGEDLVIEVPVQPKPVQNFARNKRIVGAVSTTLHGSQHLMANSMRSTFSQAANHSTENGIATGDTLSVDGVWLSYLRSNGKQKGDDNLKAYSNKLDGVTVGVEGEFALDTTAGAAFTAAKSSTNVKAELPASTKSDFYAVTVYGNRTQGNWVMNSGLSYGIGSNDHKLAHEKASNKTRTIGLALGGGYNVALSDQWTLQPGAEFNLINVHGDDMKVKDMTFSYHDLKVTELGAGLKLLGEIPTDTSLLTTEMGLKYFHNFSGKDFDGSIRSTEGTQKMTGVKNSTHRGVANFGMGYDLTSDLTLGVGYDYDFSHGYKSNSVKAKISYQF